MLIYTAEWLILIDANRKIRPPPGLDPAQICRSSRRAHSSQLMSRDITNDVIRCRHAFSVTTGFGYAAIYFTFLSAGGADILCSYYSGCDGAGADCELP
jgi:uncharacterized membrane-anchored protein YitT (DUF2179 family)